MLIPLIDEDSLRQSEVVAYDPFVVSSRLVLGPSFLYGATYHDGDEIFDGVFYHEVVANPPHTDPYESGTDTPDWNPDLGGITTSGTVKMQNIGTASRAYGRTDEVVMRLGNGSFAFLQVSFPKSTTFSVESARLVLTAPIFRMGSSSDVLLAPSVVFEPLVINPEDGAYTYNEASLLASGFVFSAGVPTTNSGAVASYAVDLDASSLFSIATLKASGSLAVEPTNVSSFQFATTEVAADLSKTMPGAANLRTTSNAATESLVVALVNPAYEPLDFESLEYPASWPPPYIDTTRVLSVGVPKFGEQVAIDLDKIIQPDRLTYTLVVFRASEEVWKGGKIKDTPRDPIFIGGDQSRDIAPYAQPKRNRRSMSQTLGGPYLAYILDTYETEFGNVSPIPWFDAAEAKRIAQRMTETNFYGDDSGLHVAVEYNSASQEFVMTQTDFRIIDDVAQNGLQTELQRIAPVRVGERLLYSIGSYDVPWLLVSTDYNPSPIIRITGGFASPLTGASDTFFVAS
jgi:hypothetical protein